jgi:hypothetical protein
MPASSSLSFLYWFFNLNFVRISCPYHPFYLPTHRASFALLNTVCWEVWILVFLVMQIVPPLFKHSWIAMFAPALCFQNSCFYVFRQSPDFTSTKCARYKNYSSELAFTLSDGQSSGKTRISELSRRKASANLKCLFILEYIFVCLLWPTCFSFITF